MDLKIKTVTVQWHESLFATSDPLASCPEMMIKYLICSNLTVKYLETFFNSSASIKVYEWMNTTFTVITVGSFPHLSMHL